MRKGVGLGIGTWLLMLSLAITIPIVAYSNYMTYQLGRSRQESLVTQLRQRTDNLAAMYQTRLDGWASALDVLARADLASGGDTASLRRQSENMLGVFPEALAIALTNSQGHAGFLTQRSGGTLTTAAIDVATARRISTSGQRGISAPYADPSSGQYMVTLGVPVVIKDDTCTLLMILPLRPFSNMLNVQDFPPHWIATLIGRSNLIMARTAEEEQLLGKPITAAGAQEIAKGAGIADLTSREGIAMKRTFAPLAGWGLTASIGVTVEAYDNLLDGGVLPVAVGGSLLVVAGAMMAGLLARRLARQVTHASAAAKVVGQGQPFIAHSAGIRELHELELSLQNAASVLHDHDEAREAERCAAVISNRLVTQILELMPVGVFILDAEGNIKQSNAMARVIWGGAHHVGLERFGEFKGWVCATGKRLTGADWAAARAIREGVTTTREELEIESFDGVRKFVLNTALPIRDQEGRIQGALSVVEDITEQTAAAEALRHAKMEAEKANVAKSRFLAAASHDLRQPVQSLMLFCSVLEQTLDGSHRHVLTHIDGAINSLRGLLDGLLDISRLDAGIVEPQIRTFAIGQMLEQMKAEYGPRAADRGLQLTVVTCRARIRSDPALLERMVRNLVENALKYTVRGRILLGCRWSDDNELRIEVHDTGVGIPQDQQELVFGEFHQLSNPERDQSKGLGLGLSIVQRLSGLMGHPVSLSSQPGTGSCFAITVPRAADE